MHLGTTTPTPDWHALLLYSDPTSPQSRGRTSMGRDEEGEQTKQKCKNDFCVSTEKTLFHTPSASRLQTLPYPSRSPLMHNLTDYTHLRTLSPPQSQKGTRIALLPRFVPRRRGGSRSHHRPKPAHQFSLSRLQNLKRTHQVFIHGHHGACIVKLAAVVGG